MHDSVSGNTGGSDVVNTQRKSVRVRVSERGRGSDSERWEVYGYRCTCMIDLSSVV